MSNMARFERRNAVWTSGTPKNRQVLVGTFERRKLEPHA